MQGSPPEEVTPFVFSDPTGKRWPRLRLILLIVGVLFFLGTVVFVQTLFVAPKMNVPFSLRQLKGQLKALQKQNPADQLSPSSLLWQKFTAARQAAKKLAGAAPAPSLRDSRKKSPNNEVRLAFYANGDPYSYASLEQHAGADYTSLSGMDDRNQWLGRFTNRRRHPAIETDRKQGDRAAAATDKSRRRHLAAGSD